MWVYLFSYGTIWLGLFIIYSWLGRRELVLLEYTPPPDPLHYVVLLPGGSYFTLLVIRRAHERVFHNGVKETLNEVCVRFWVLRQRATVQKLVHKCVLCHRLEGQAYATPQMPPLHVFRVSVEPPFSYVGVDLQDQSNLCQE